MHPSQRPSTRTGDRTTDDLPSPPMTDAIEPFTVAVPQHQLDDLADRLQRTRWPDEETTVGTDEPRVRNITSVPTRGARIKVTSRVGG